MYQARSVAPWPAQKRNLVILPLDAEWCVLGQMQSYVQNLTSGAWTTANTAVGFWITAPYACTVKKITVLNGGTAGGNSDVAIYDSDGTTRLVSTGSFLRSGNSQLNAWIDTTDLALTAGKNYFVAMNHDATTVGQVYVASSSLGTVGVQRLLGIKVQAVGAVTLPNPFVPADSAAAVAIGCVALSLDTNT